MNATPPDTLPFTGDPEADALLASDPLALLIGFVLDQQVTIQKAFGGPLELRTRIGSLDAAAIAGMGPSQLEDVFRRPPALHRFPANMARRTQAFCAAIADGYGGDARRIWAEAADGPDLEARLLALPGIGEMKAKSIMAVLAHHFGLELAGLEAVLPAHRTLGDVDSAESLAAYQAGKRASKQAGKAAAVMPDPDADEPPLR